MQQTPKATAKPQAAPRPQQGARKVAAPKVATPESGSVATASPKSAVAGVLTLNPQGFRAATAQAPVPGAAVPKTATPKLGTVPLRQPIKLVPAGTAQGRGHAQATQGIAKAETQAGKVALASAPTAQAAVLRLTDAQLRSGKAWYAARASQYTPAVMRDIQAKLAIPVTGKVDTATLQAVAKWQAANKPQPINGQTGPFPVNGKADGVLLNHLFPTGLSQPKILKPYVKDMKALVGKWPSLTPAQRLTTLSNVLNRALASAGVPATAIGGKAFKDATGANFDFSSWSVNVSQQLLDHKKLTPEQAAHLADTLLHEAEHTVQWFNMAQLQAGRRQQIEQTMDIPVLIAKQAAASPIKPASVSGIKVDAYYQSVYGSGATERSRVLNDLSRQGEQLNAAIQLVKKNNQTLLNLQRKIEATRDETKQTQYMNEYNKLATLYRDKEVEKSDIETRFGSTWNLYSALPEESDAWRTGGIAGAAYEKK